MSGRLEDKTALITGAARGIGLEFAKSYVLEGARVCIADIDIDRARMTKPQKLGECAYAVHLDVRDQRASTQPWIETISRFGQIDILVNNAALFSAAPIVEIERSDFQTLFDVNVSGPFVHDAGRSQAHD